MTDEHPGIKFNIMKRWRERVQKWKGYEPFLHDIDVAMAMAKADWEILDEHSKSKRNEA